MRGYRGIVLGLAMGGCAIDCAQLAGIEDLQLTAGGPDATTDEAGDDAHAESSAFLDGAAPDAHPQEAGPDSSSNVHLDATSDAPHDAPPSADASEAGITYAQEVMMDNPLAYWRFDETSGTVAVDSSGHGNDGTYVGDVTLGQPGAIANDPGTSVKFDGMTAWMSAGDVLAFTGTAPCSFEAWVNPVLDTYYHDVLSRTDGQGGTTVGYLMYVEPQAAPAMVDFAHYSGSSSNIAESNTAVASGVFTHLVGVYDGTTIYIYGNGALLDSKPTDFATPATTSPFVVAAQSGGLTSWFNGEIDEVAVYGAALPPSRIQAHYQVGIGQAP